MIKEDQSDDAKIIEKLFTYPDNKNIQANRSRNLIVNPQMLRVIIQKHQSSPISTKKIIWNQISKIFSANNLNTSILTKRDKQLLEYNHSIYDQLISFIFSFKCTRQDTQQILQIFQPIISGYPITCRNIKNIINKVSVNFHRQKFDAQKLQLCINLLTFIFKDQVWPQKSPQSYFVMYGINSGLRLTNRHLKWSLNKGFSFYIGFKIQKGYHEQSSLLSMLLNDDSFDLILDEGNYLRLKVFGTDKVFSFRKLEQKKWYFLTLSYKLKTGIIRNSYHLVIHLQGDPYQLTNLPVPSLSMKHEIEQLVVGHNFFGKINIACISREQLHSWSKFGFNTQAQLQNFLTINKNNLKEIFLLYTPLICTQLNNNLVIYDIINQNHTEMLDNTTIFQHPFQSVDINYYGGLYTLAPFFYILRFYKYEQYPTALQQALQMVFNLFVLKYKNIEEQAINCHFFGLLGQFLNHLDQRYFTVKVIEMIRVWRELIKNKNLLKHFFINFLTKFSIDRIDDKDVASRWLNLIGNMYYRDFQWAIQLFPISELVWYIIDNYEPQNSEECCLLHYCEKVGCPIDKKIIYIKDQYKNKGQTIIQILSYILKQIFKRHNFDLFSTNYDIIQFLLHKYSICFNSLLMQCLLAGVIQQPLYFIKQTQILQTLYSLLPQAQTKDQLIPILRILNEIMKVCNGKLQNIYFQIVAHLGEHLDKLYMKKYAKIKLRSKSQVIHQNILTRKSSERKFSIQAEEYSSNFGLGVAVNTKLEQIKYKNRVIQLRKLRKTKLSNDRHLYATIIDLCCAQDHETGDLVLKNDELVKIIAPYFKICSLKLKTNLIQIVKMTVFLKSAQQNLPPHMQCLSKLDFIYRFILSQFVLKQLDPQDPQYQPSQKSNYIMKNLYYIIDNMVHTMKNDWNSLYMYLIRLIQLLKEARKDIQRKTSRSREDILRATKVSSRKFILRILNWAQTSLNSMSNMVFFVYLVVFNNSKSQFYSVFDYFKSLQENFFIDTIQIINQFQHKTIQKPIFIDQRIILSVIEAFHLQFFFKDKTRKNYLNQIKAYLQIQQQNETQRKISKLRQIFLSSTQFREMGSQYKGFKMFIHFTYSDDKNRQKNVLVMHVAEIIAIMLCLCIQSSVSEKRFPILEQSLVNLEHFIRIFILSMSRDNLKKQKHCQRNKKLPKNLVFHIIHFLYVILERQIEQSFHNAIENAIYNIVYYLTLVMTILCDKVGNPENSEDVQMLSAVMQDVEYFNFYSFSLLPSNVITIGQIKVFSTLQRQKGFEVIRHPHLKQYFKQVSKTFIEKHVRQVVQIHRHNLQKAQKQINQKFTKKIETGRIIIDTNKFYDKQKFDKLIIDHARILNVQYRQIMRIWRKIWKRLRLFHYYWSIGMDQREQFCQFWKKSQQRQFKHKFSKYTDIDGLRPILEVEPYEPWHIRKARLDQQVEYRSKNFMQNLHKETLKKISQPKSFIDKIFRKSYSGATFSVHWIKHNSKRKGTLSLQHQKMIFEYDSTFQKDSHVDFTPFLLAEHRPMKKRWPIVCITNIMRRRYLMKNQCLLIQFEDTTSLIFHFLNQDTEQFLFRIEQIQLQKQQKLSLMKLNNIKFYLKNFRTRNIYQQIEQYTQQWNQGKITNLHYIMLINKYSGRSCLDPVNYPVLPWVISNYDCKELVIRDLSKTLGALGSETRKQFYQNKYDSIDPFSNVPPYQYGTHYSSPGVVFNFLIRLSPYTQAAKSLQGGRFDLSDRLFSSVKVCWNSVTNEVSDVRQLLPQFFYLPQFLTNIQNYDFGLTQKKQRVHHVKLPTWGSTPWDFIANHRRVLQSEEVTASINNWIDLIFGYKQKGKLAKQNINLYYYLTYQNSINLSQIQNQIQRTSIQAQIIHFGQTPSQLFFKPHPQNARSQKSPQNKSAEVHKIKFLGIIESVSSIVLIGWQGNQNGKLLIFRDSFLIGVSEQDRIQMKSEINLKRNASKENIYHVQDLQFIQKVHLFAKNRFIVIGSYVNGDLVVYTTSGQKVQHHKGFPKSIVYVNNDENLILCGSKNGLLEVYQIVYFEKDNLKLIKIISEYFMYPIQHISQGAGFYSLSCGNLVIISKISRSLTYVHQKIKMQGQKMIRSFQSKRKVYGSFICTNPLYCVVLYNLLEVIVYSINGQLIHLKQIQSLVDPIIVIDEKKRQNILCLQPTGLSLLSLPYLKTIVHIVMPKRQYTHMKLINNRIYLTTSGGEIYYVFNHKQMIWI